MKNVCIVGYGAIGPIHAAALEDTKEAKLYGVCDIDPSKRKRCVEEYATKGLVIREYDDFDNMLLDANVHSVHICTPHYLHFEMMKKALAAGKDVVTEKPITITAKEYDELLALKDSERVCVVLQNRLNPCVQRLKQIIDEKELGEIKSVRSLLTWHRTRAYYEKSDWRGKWATEGGGLLINQAVHTLDYFSYLIGNVISVKANMFNYSLEGVIEVEDTLSAIIRFESGVQGVFFATNAYESNSAPFFEVAFENGIARYIDNQLWMNGELLAEDKVPVAGKAYWGSGHSGLIKRFYDQGEHFTVMSAKNTMETMFAIYDSAKDGGREKSVLQNS